MLMERRWQWSLEPVQVHYNDGCNGVWSCVREQVVKGNRF